LRVEIDGDAASLVEYLDQFTIKEWLDGENMYNKLEGYILDNDTNYISASNAKISSVSNYLNFRFHLYLSFLIHLYPCINLIIV
jgi:hypothetical protein